MYQEFLLYTGEREFFFFLLHLILSLHKLFYMTFLGTKNPSVRDFFNIINTKFTDIIFEVRIQQLQFVELKEISSFSLSPNKYIN